MALPRSRSSTAARLSSSCGSWSERWDCVPEALTSPTGGPSEAGAAASPAAGVAADHRSVAALGDEMREPPEALMALGGEIEELLNGRPTDVCTGQFNGAPISNQCICADFFR